MTANRPKNRNILAPYSTIPCRNNATQPSQTDGPAALASTASNVELQRNKASLANFA
jgi:hypothetical protein